MLNSSISQFSVTQIQLFLTTPRLRALQEYSFLSSEHQSLAINWLILSSNSLKCKFCQERALFLLSYAMDVINAAAFIRGPAFIVSNKLDPWRLLEVRPLLEVRRLIPIMHNELGSECNAVGSSGDLWCC